MKIYNVEEYIDLGYHIGEGLKVRDQEQKLMALNSDLQTAKDILSFLGKDVGELWIEMGRLNPEDNLGDYDNSYLRDIVEFGFEHGTISTTALIMGEPRQGIEIDFRKNDDDSYYLDCYEEGVNNEYWENSFDRILFQPVSLKERIEDFLGGFIYSPFKDEESQRSWYYIIKRNMLRTLKLCITNNINTTIFDRFEERLCPGVRKDWVLTTLDPFKYLTSGEAGWFLDNGDVKEVIGEDGKHYRADNLNPMILYENIRD